MAIVTKHDKELYIQQFENKDKLVGQTISQVIFYLEDDKHDFTEQENDFGKSLFNGIDIKTKDLTFSIGNRYSGLGYGLSIDLETTRKVEFFDEERKPIPYKTSIVGHQVKQVEIYWMNVPFDGEKGLYPQEIEIITDKGFLMISSMEIANGEVCMEFTDELLVIDQPKIAEQLQLGHFGVADNYRIHYKTLDELMQHETKGGK